MNGLRAVVTGGTRGIGEAVARRFAEMGAAVVIAARGRPELPPAGRLVQADLASAEGVLALADQVLAELGGVDVIVDNAGSQTFVPGGARETTDADWERDLSTNLLSAVRLDRALLPAMIAQGSGGSIVHVSSGQARLPGPASLPYAAAKAALTTYSKGLARELGPHGIRVNTVFPGLIETSAVTARIALMASSGGDDLAVARQALIDRVGIPLGTPGTPEDVADLIAFLVSDRARYITGTTQIVDGGAMPTV